MTYKLIRELETAAQSDDTSPEQLKLLVQRASVEVPVLMDVALCIYDHLTDAVMCGGTTLTRMCAILQDNGIGEGREMAVELSGAVEEAWQIANNNGDNYVEPFDLEFVPEFLERAEDALMDANRDNPGCGLSEAGKQIAIEMRKEHTPK